MATEKIFFSILFLLSFIILTKGKNEPIKYNQTSNNFLDTNVNIKNAIDYTLSIIEGEIIKVEKKYKKGNPLWNINLITKEKATIELELDLKSDKVLSIEASEGPFSYDIKPDSNLVSFSTAKKSAEELAGEKVLKWRFNQNREKWEYSFWLFTKSGTAQVKVDAESGEIITKQKKKK